MIFISKVFFSLSALISSPSPNSDSPVLWELAFQTNDSWILSGGYGAVLDSSPLNDLHDPHGYPVSTLMVDFSCEGGLPESHQLQSRSGIFLLYKNPISFSQDSGFISVSVRSNEAYKLFVLTHGKDGKNEEHEMFLNPEKKDGWVLWSSIISYADALLTQKNVSEDVSTDTSSEELTHPRHFRGFFLQFHHQNKSGIKNYHFGGIKLSHGSNP